MGVDGRNSSFWMEREEKNMSVKILIAAIETSSGCHKQREKSMEGCWDPLVNVRLEGQA